MPYAIANEPELLQQLIAGDVAAFRELYEGYQGRLFLFAYRFTKSKDVAEEIVQEVFVKLWEKREQIKIEKNFSAYITMVARNLILDGLKRASRDKKLQQKVFSNMQALRSTSGEQLLQKEMERLYQQAVDNLTPQRKKVYLLSREEELSYQEIADRLGISKNTVRNMMTSAIQSIREEITNHPDLTCLVMAIVMHGVK